MTDSALKRAWLVLLLAAAALAPAVFAGEPVVNPVSVHVLNTQDGRPAPGVLVILEGKTADGWKTLAKGRTADSGRINALYPDGKTMPTGTYRIRFETGAWYHEHGKDTFFPEIPIVFHATAGQHYHIPLLLSPFGYTTYRGS